MDTKKRPTVVTVTRKVATSIEQIRADVSAVYDGARIDVDAEDRRGKARIRTACTFGLTLVDTAIAPAAGCAEE